jgi:hypothetical protein
LNTKPDDTLREAIDTGIDWETLDSQISVVLRDTQAALEEALAATQKLGRWVECLHSLSAFMRQVESGLGEVRHQLKGPPEAGPSAPLPSTVRKADIAEAVEPWPLEAEGAEAAEPGEEPPLTALEAREAESVAQPFEAAAVVEAEEPPGPAEGKPLETAPLVAEVRDSIRLQIESSEANIDLMVVERALRETPGVADVDLLDYAGKRARVQVTFSGGERPEEVADRERLAASVQERLAKLTWNGSLSVSATE